MVEGVRRAVVHGIDDARGNEILDAAELGRRQPEEILDRLGIGRAALIRVVAQGTDLEGVVARVFEDLVTIEMRPGDVPGAHDA